MLKMTNCGSQVPQSLRSLAVAACHQEPSLWHRGEGVGYGPGLLSRSQSQGVQSWIPAILQSCPSIYKHGVGYNPVRSHRKGWRPHNCVTLNVTMLPFTPICGESSLYANEGQLSEINQYAINVIVIHYTKSKRKSVDFSELLEQMITLLRLKLGKIHWADAIVEPNKFFFEKVYWS